MLKLILGEAGTGKSALLYEKIKSSAEAGRKAFLFVPDQFSFEAEKKLYKTFSRGGDELMRSYRRAQVTTFSRCAAKLLHLFGQTKEYADDMVKRILMKRAVEQALSEGSLEYYAGQVRKRGFPAFVLNLAGGFRSAGLTPADLKKTLSEENSFSETLTRKMNDLCVIYGIYDALLTASFDDKLDDTRRAARIAAESGFFEGADIFFDCFDSFSGDQFIFIKSLLSKAESVTFAFTCDGEDTPKRCFRGVLRTIGKLSEAVKKYGGEPGITLMKERLRDFDDLTVVRAADMRRECDWICSEVIRICESGQRYRDIAILSPDRDYVMILDSAMKKYGIPCFTDIPEPMITKSFVRFALFALKALSFSTDDILRYVKSGFVRHTDGKTISNIQADALESFCKKYDLRRRDWLKPFPKKLDPEGELEALRKSIIEPLRGLAKQIPQDDTSKADGAEMTKALCSFLCEKMDIGRTLYGRCIKARDEHGRAIVDNIKADAYSTLWDDTVTIFESAYRALGGCMLSSGEFSDILGDIFAAATVAKPPQVLDAVTVGDMERSRLPEMKTVFICGAEQGVMPPEPKVSEAFTGAETQMLSERGIQLSSDRLTRFSSELFTVYRCVRMPSERLYLTYSLSDERGKPLEPSSYIEDICADFREEKKKEPVYKKAEDESAAFFCRTIPAVKRYISGIYRDPARAAERAALKEKLPPDYKFVLDYSAGFVPDTERHLVSRDIAGPLLSRGEYSPTALGRAKDCKFSYFCLYGLDLKPDDLREMNPLLVGNVIHYCLQRLLTDYIGRREEFEQLSGDDIKAHTEKSIEEYRREFYCEDFGGSERFAYLLRRLGICAVRSAEKIRDDIKGSEFYPEALEKELSFSFGDITIKGKCDRYDTAEKDGKKYVRVVDYKRGDKKLELSGVYKGSDLQMLLYLFGLCGDGGLDPSSVMYLPVGRINYQEPKGKGRSAGSDLGLKHYTREHSRRGIYIAGTPDEEEIKKQNAALSGKFKLKSSERAFIETTEITDSQYEGIKSYCRSFVNAKIKEVLCGMASACPENDKEACAYCEYDLFCGHKRAAEEDDENK